jgi:glucose-1-phosphate adenylyltransferase
LEPSLVILAGGVSSRMKKPSAVPPGTDEQLLREADRLAKAMIGVGRNGRPFMDYLLFNAREAGYRDVVLVVGEDNAGIRSYYGSMDRDNEYHGLRISYAVQKVPPGRTKPLGTADAVVCAMDARPDWAGTKFTVCNSDNLYSHHVLRMLRESSDTCALIDYDWEALKVDPSKLEQFAVLQKDAGNYLVRIIEKPPPATIAAVRDQSGRVGVSMNIFRFSYDMMLQPLIDAPIHPVRQEKEIPSALTMLIARHPKSVFAIPVEEEVPDLTDKKDIARVQQYLQQHYPGFEF